MDLTFTQCKQIINNGHDLRDFLEAVQDQPYWLISMGEIDSISEIQAIIQGGCASGACMPAVTHRTALDTMTDHGNDILDFIESELGGRLAPNSGESWSGMAVFYCSYAVELWCSQFADILDNVDWD